MREQSNEFFDVDIEWLLRTGVVSSPSGAEWKWIMRFPSDNLSQVENVDMRRRLYFYFITVIL